MTASLTPLLGVTTLETAMFLSVVSSLGFALTSKFFAEIQKQAH